MQYPIMQSNRKPLINAESYQSMYDYSISNPDEFWAEQADKFIDWDKKWDRVSDVDFSKGKIAWFEGATLNVGKDKPTVVALREIEAGLIDGSILTEEYAMEEELNAHDRLAQEAKTSEVAAELSDVKLDSEAESDDLAVKEVDE